MFGYINSAIYLYKTCEFVSKFIFYLYLYRNIYNSITVDVVKKTSRGDNKIIRKSRILLGIFYFALIMLLWHTLSTKVLFCNMLVLILTTMYSCNNWLLKKSSLHLYDNNKFLKLFWKIFSTILIIIFMCLKPIFTIIDDKYNEIKMNFTNFFSDINTKNHEEIFVCTKDEFIEITNNELNEKTIELANFNIQEENIKFENNNEEFEITNEEFKINNEKIE